MDPAATRIDNRLYDRLGDGWWNPEGPIGCLHEMNPIRWIYFDRVFTRLLGAEIKESGRLLDVGCGGGLLTEAMARLGYSITGFDISESSLEAARRHAAMEGVAVEYRRGSAYRLEVESGSADGVIASDVFEHLHDLPGAAREIARVLKPAGVLVFDTVNRTWFSFLAAVLVAQKLLRLMPPRTHEWRMFVRPEELGIVLERQGLEIGEIQGMSPAASSLTLFYRALKNRKLGEFVLSRDLRIGYIGYAVKRGSSHRAGS